MVHIGGGLEILMDDKKIVQVVADGNDGFDIGLPGFLRDDELFDRVLVNQPDVSVSIKKLHGFSPAVRCGLRVFPNSQSKG
jgi:hypothetical protein